MTRHHHLRRLLETFTPADTQEREHRARILQLLDSSSEAFSRTHYSPGHITASAFVLDPSHTSLLLILHGKLLKWLQPGGHVDPEDRDVLESARREVFEEVAVAALGQIGDGLLDLDVHAIPARGDQPAHEHFDVRFLFEAKDTRFTAGSDARDARWVPIEQLLGHGTRTPSEYPSDDSVLRAVRKLRGLRGATA
jgi:8-oxo-dGTP pyrophosphatase MutT (NUDIX family)